MLLEPLRFLAWVCFCCRFRSWWKTLPLLCLKGPFMGLFFSLPRSLASVSQILLFYSSAAETLNVVNLSTKAAEA